MMCTKLPSLDRQRSHEPTAETSTIQKNSQNHGTVDRPARDAMIAAMNAYMNEEIGTFEFDDRLDAIQTKDAAVNDAISIVWYYYDDCTDHPICVNHDTWNLFWRMILLLRSDVEMIQTRQKRWSITQILAGVVLIAFFATWYPFPFSALGNGLAGYAPYLCWTGIGLVTWYIRRYRLRRFPSEETQRMRTSSCYPFHSTHEIFRILKSIPSAQTAQSNESKSTTKRFQKKKYPPHLDRPIQRGWLDKISVMSGHVLWIPLIAVGWTLVSPLVLIRQCFPASVVDFHLLFHNHETPCTE